MLAVLSGGSICLWVSMTPMNSEEITLCSGSVNQGGLSAFGIHIFIYALVSICLWYLHVFSMHWYFLIFSYYLTVWNWLSLVTLKSIEFTQHAGSFEWGVHLPLSLNDTNEQWRDHSVLWQWSGGVHLPLMSVSLYMHWYFIYCKIYLVSHWHFLYLPISWLFQMGSHWLHWKAKSSLWSLAVLNGGGGSSTDTHTN